MTSVFSSKQYSMSNSSGNNTDNANKNPRNSIIVSAKRFNTFRLMLLCLLWVPTCNVLQFL